jgi:CheY-like chemotaxis protein
MNDLPAERNRRILVIDDNRAIHDDFRKILSRGTITATVLDKPGTELFAEPANEVRQIRYEISRMG